jgi:uncharacterized protein
MACMAFFEWDETKAEINRRKHGIDFDDAAEVFYDPFFLSEKDCVVDNELRWQTLGMVDGAIILLIAHVDYEVDGEEIIRIISARRANRKECKRYGKNRAEGLG